MSVLSPESTEPQALQIACRAVDAAPAPALVISAGRVYANAAGAHWLVRFEPSWPTTAGDLPSNHALTRELRQLAHRAAEARTSIPVQLRPLETHIITASETGAPGASLIVAWLQARDPIPAELALMRERLAAAAGVARVGLFERDLVSGEGAWDPICYELFGVDSAQGVPDRQAGLQYIDPRDRDRVQLGIARFTVAPLGSEFVIDFRVMRPDGGWRHLESRSKIVPGRDGHGRRAVGALLDVSERFRADEVRHELTQRLEQIAEAGRVGLWLFNPLTRVSEWNAQMYTLSGRHPEAGPMTLEEALACVHPDDRETSAATALIEHGLPVQARLRLFHPDGSLRWVFVRASRIGGDSPHLAAAIVDITELQAAEARNQKLNERLNLAVSAAGIGIYDIDVATGKATWNDRLYALMLRSPEEQPFDLYEWSQQLHADDRQRVQDRMRQLLLEGGSHYEQYRMVRADRSVIELDVQATAVKDEHGKVARIVGTFRDVTTERRAIADREQLLTRLQLATSVANIGLWESRLDDGTEVLDDAVCRLLGLGSGPQLRNARDFLDRAHPDDLDELNRTFVASLESGAPTVGPLAFRVVRPDGELRHVLSHGAIERDVTGRARKILGTALDVTDLKRAQERAQRVAERLEVATALGGLGVFERDADDRFLYYDGVVRSLWRDGEFNADEPMDPLTPVLPEDRPLLAAARQRMRAVDEPVRCEYRVATIDGGIREVLSWRRRRLDAHGQYAGEIGTLIDITDLREAQRSAQAHSTRLSIATSSAGIGCWQVSVPDPIEPGNASGAGNERPQAQWDEQMYRLCDATPADGTPDEVMARCIHPEDWPKYQAAMAEAATRGEFSCELRVRRREDGWRWIAARAKLRTMASGSELLGVAWDVTESREAESALLAKEAAERASRAKSEFLSRMSHELRTPLNAIVGFTQLLELDPGDPMSATQRERVGLIRSAGWHLLKLINDVLDLSRIESGRSNVAMEVVAWQDVLDDAISMVQANATDRGIVLETRHAGDVPDTVWADPVRLRQVLLNLLSNAVNFNRDNGSVQVQVRADHDYLVFAVRDSGRGMSANQMSRLFQPFNRLGVGSNTPGSGIGLAISQRLVQQMDGEIEVDSQVGVGTEFRVRLRAARVQARPLTPLAAPAALRLSMREDVTGTLLYIEDNPANSALVEQFLQFRPRVKLFQAADGATGLVMAAVCQPDLVLIDIRLPDMMGDEVLQQLRRQPETRALTCVAVSANAMPHDIEAALAAGFADYWTKPLEVTRFLQGVDERLAAVSGAHALHGGAAA